jgi:diguanylate cyclase (GGDEF)-like protein
MGWQSNKPRGRRTEAPLHPQRDATQGRSHDLGELSRLRQLDADRRRFFHQVVTGESMEIILRGLAKMLELQFPGSRVAAIVPSEGKFFASRPDEDDKALMEAASIAVATSSDLVNQAMDRTAAIWADVAVSDLAADPTWSSQRATLERLQMQACWTALIPTPRACPGGAICLMMPENRRPTAMETELVRSAAAQAGIALEQHQLGQRLAHQSLHDTITGLPNRALLQDRLTQALNQSQRTGEQVGLFLLDLDGFKFINDTLGQADCDALLRAIADRLLGSVRRSDTLARLKGDEFLFVACNLDDRRGSAAVAEKLLALLAAPFVVNGRELFLTASLGISLFPIDGSDAATLQRNAEAALSRAKSQGRGSMAFFAPEMNAAALERLELEGELRHAIEAGEFRLHYQPQVDFRGQCFAVEALVRWQHPRLGLVPPGRFIPIAEESGLILPLGEWVLREACRQLQAWSDRPILSQLRIAVNVSALQFAQPNFVATVAHILNETQLDPRRLELELTESLLMHNTPEESEKVASLRRTGVTLAIDDFGTGYASLSYLHRLPIDTLKIDRAFVEAIDARPPADSDHNGELGDAETSSRTAVIRAILLMGRSLGINVLAEGVETECQRDFLIRHGCEMMQGYFFGRPVPAGEIEKKLEAPAMALSA